VMAWGRWLYVSVNGYRTLDVDLDDFAAQAESLPGLNREKGRIGLQSWQGTVQYRNVQIRRLPAP
jgi:3-keto-disaccharide hydrolase